jgi:hypothetical protein
MAPCQIDINPLFAAFIPKEIGQMAGHTVGPWKHVTDDGSVGTVEGVDGWAVALAQSRPNDPRHEERQANARLIAAAPDLLKALRMMMKLECPLTGKPSHETLVKHWEYEKSEGNGAADYYLFAMEALAKAGGSVH